MLKKNLVILSFLTLIGFSSCEHDESKTVSFAYQQGDLTNNADIIMSAFVGDSCKLWLGFGAKEFIKEPNKWTNVKGRFNLSPAITSAENLKITVMAHNIDAKSYFDVDDLKIMFTEEDENN